LQSKGLTALEFFAAEIERWKRSKERTAQLDGERYYIGDHDILQRKRTAIGKNGPITLDNLPNNQIVDNQYGKMVDQKTNYLLGQKFKIDADDEAYAMALSEVFDRRFHRLLQNIGGDSLNGGIGWLYPYYDADKLRFRRLPPYEVLPFWADDQHTELDAVVRLYASEVYEGQTLKTVERVEIYSSDGIGRYILTDGKLKDDPYNPHSSYIVRKGVAGEETGFNWDRLPVVPFKYNAKEIPLISRTKSLQDAINAIMSDFVNNMQEDSRNTILVIKNYDGEDLAQFRQNLAAYGAVKVRTVDGAAGAVETLQIEVNHHNYQALLEILKRALVENAMGFDAKNLRSSTPNQMNIQSMYSDVDLDANGMEAEYQAAFEDLLFFINAYLANTGKGDFSGKSVEIIFNRDMLMNEAESIDNLKKSVGIISRETLLAQHPWVSDVEAEQNRLDTEARRRLDDYGGAFGDQGGDGDPNAQQ